MTESPISVIVVSFNTKDKLRRCLSCIEREHEVIVVDNASADGSAEMVETEFPWVRLIRSQENLGFGRANNLAMDAATRPLMLLLNSDCYAHPGSIALLAEAIEDGVVAAGGKLLNPDGSLQESVAGDLTLRAVLFEQLYLDSLARRLDPRLAYWQTRQVLVQANPVAEAPQVMGACLMMRPLERFDPRYFLYCEDTDLCKRLRAHGRIVYFPAAEFTHELGSSSAGSRWRAVARYNWGKELYFKIHHGTLAATTCFLLDRLGALLRLVVWSAITILRPSRRSQVALFWKVLTAPTRETR
jgi:GT2 family glycosyltransferase